MKGTSKQETLPATLASILVPASLERIRLFSNLCKKWGSGGGSSGRAAGGSLSSQSEFDFYFLSISGTSLKQVPRRGAVLTDF